MSANGINGNKWLTWNMASKFQIGVLEKRKNWRPGSYFLQKQIENFYLIMYGFEPNSNVQTNYKHVLKSFTLKYFPFSLKFQWIVFDQSYLDTLKNTIVLHTNILMFCSSSVLWKIEAMY